MISLSIVRVPASPEAMFRCEHYRCTLAGRVCIERQNYRYKAHSKAPERAPAHLQHCAYGKCEQGRDVAAVLAGWAPTVRAADQAHAAAKTAAPLRLAQIEQQIADAKAAPAEETTMANETDRHVCTRDGCTRNLSRANKSGVCSRQCESEDAPAWNRVKGDEKVRARKSAEAPLPKQPRATKPTSSAQPDDELAVIAALLSQVRALTPAGRAYVADRIARGT